MLTRGFEVVSRLSDIQMPARSTAGSAGYDFYAPEDIVVPSHLMMWGEAYKTSGLIGAPFPTPFCIKTGIKAYMASDEVLQLYIRSSAPSKLGLVMANSVGIIDSDYYNNPENEGEIGFLVYNITQKNIIIHKGDKIGQGIFTKFLRIDDDADDQGTRTGGFGSTGI